MNQDRNRKALALYQASGFSSWDGTFAPLQVCLLCGSGGPPQVTPESRCATCGSPLAMPPSQTELTGEHVGRRGAPRRDRHHLANLQLGWPSLPRPVRWRDLSLTGLSVHTEFAVAVGQMVRVSDAGVDVLAEVVQCRPRGNLYTVHARLLRARFEQTSGVFVSTRA